MFFIIAIMCLYPILKNAKRYNKKLEKDLRDIISKKNIFKLLISYVISMTFLTLKIPTEEIAINIGSSLLILYYYFIIDIISSRLGK